MQLLDLFNSALVTHLLQGYELRLLHLLKQQLRWSDSSFDRKLKQRLTDHNIKCCQTVVEEHDHLNVADGQALKLHTIRVPQALAFEK